MEPAIIHVIARSGPQGRDEAISPVKKRLLGLLRPLARLGTSQ
jgi:hypothetical protein